MRWLWLVSVGTTDIQFPAWLQDETGSWSSRRRIEIGGQGNLRQIHEALLSLAAEPECILFCKDELERFRSARGPTIDTLKVDGQMVFSARLGSALKEGEKRDDTGPIRISASGDELPNSSDPALPLFFPKVAPLALVMASARGTAELVVVVLNTCRTSGRDAKKEPVAAGPLVARFLVQELQLDYLEGGDTVPGSLPSNSCTWLNILQGSERLEDASVEDALRKRLNAAIDAFKPGPDDRVVISTGGGLPPLKPLLERIPATRVGSKAVAVLDSPEGSKQNTLSLQPLAERWLDRETLRFHCTQALRDGDYPSAYGLARRSQGSGWADKVVSCLGPLLELPSAGADIRSLALLEPYELRAARVEAALVMSDLSTAIRSLSVFLESALWEVLLRSDAIADAGLEVDPGRELLYFAQDRVLGDELGRLLEPVWNEPGRLRLSKRRMFRDLPSWLALNEKLPAVRDAALALKILGTAYLKMTGKLDAQRKVIDDSIREVRNQLSHGAGPAVDLATAQKNLKARGLAVAIGAELGGNFLCQTDVTSLLESLSRPDAPDLTSRLKGVLDSTLETAARGDA